MSGVGCEEGCSQPIRGSGGALWAPSVGSGAEPQPEMHFGIFWRPHNAPFCTYILKYLGMARPRFPCPNIEPFLASWGLCDVARVLLQCHSRWGAQVHNWQASASTECRCSYHQWHLQVRPRPVISSTRGAALTGCFSVSAVQAVCNCPPVSAIHSSTIPDGMLHSALLHHLLAAPAVYQLSPAVRIPRHRRSIFGRWLLSVSGRMAWNLLTDTLRDQTRSFDSFQCDFKTFVSLLAYTVH